MATKSTVKFKITTVGFSGDEQYMQRVQLKVI